MTCSLSNAYGRYKDAVYDGTFCQGLFDGKNGVLTYENGDIFEGEFIMGFYSYGTYKSTNGEYMVGLFSDDMPEDVEMFDKEGNSLGPVFTIHK